MPQKQELPEYDHRDGSNAFMQMEADGVVELYHWEDASGAVVPFDEGKADPKTFRQRVKLYPGIVAREILEGGTGLYRTDPGSKPRAARVPKATRKTRPKASAKKVAPKPKAAPAASLPRRSIAEAPA